MSDHDVCPVRRFARSEPDRPALRFDQQAMTYAQLDTAVDALASLFPKFPSKTRIALATPEKSQLVQQVLACWRRGYVAVPLDHRLPRGSFNELANQLGAVVWNETGFHHRTEQTGTKGSLSPATAQDWSDILLTSGTTGAPKGVVHTFANHKASASGLWQALNDLEAGPLHARWLLCLPLFHIAGFSLIWRVFGVGGCLVIPPRNLPLVEALCSGVSHASLVPAQVLPLPEPPHEPPLNLIMLGGEPVSRPVLERARGWARRVVISYGCSEACSTVGLAVPRNSQDFPTEFQVLPGREVVTQGGELLLKGAVLSPGYLTDHGIAPIPAAGFPSGDLGNISESGVFTVTGRKGRRFISGGENIQPEAIERVLLARSDIDRAAVVPVPHSRYGQRPVAFVQARNTWQPQEWAKAVQAVLPGYMVPDHWLAWPDPSVLKPKLADWQALAAIIVAHDT